jgi:ribosomal protein S18 acetylase RimI-like enzyme
LQLALIASIGADRSGRREVFKSMSANRNLTITRWHRDRAPELAQAFHDINAAWITAMFRLEEADRKTLLNPQGAIIDKGGDILFVEADGLGIVGACALMPHEDGGVELTKMGVLDTARGQKAGEALLAAVLERAEQMQVATLFLLTNHICEAAIHLYEKAGFVHDAEIMERYGCNYQRCDIAMRYAGGAAPAV